MKRILLRAAACILVLLLSLSAFSCGKEPPETDPAQSAEQSEKETDPATDPVTDPATEPSAEPETDPVTEPVTQPATEAVTEPATEPVTEAVTEPAAPKDPVTYTMADGTVFTFSPALPERFMTGDTIRIDGGSYDGNGVHALEVSGITHYYLDTGGTTYVDPDGNRLAKGSYYMSYDFEIPEDGVYEFCIEMRMKDTKHRYNLISFDEGEQTLMEFELNDAQVEDARDADTVGSFMTGFTVELTSGFHTVTMKILEEHGASFHFRNIYIAKAE